MPWRLRRVAALERHERDWIGVILIRRMHAAFDVGPLGGVETGEEGVARHVGLHVGEIDAARNRQHQTIDLRAAYHHQLVAAAAVLERLLHRVHHDRAGGEPAAIPCQYEVDAPGKRASDGLEGLAAHEYGLTERESLEALEILRQTPRQRVAPADDAVLRHRNDQRNQRLRGAHARSTTSVAPGKPSVV